MRHTDLWIKWENKYFSEQDKFVKAMGVMFWKVIPCLIVAALDPSLSCCYTLIVISFFAHYSKVILIETSQFKFNTNKDADGKFCIHLFDTASKLALGTKSRIIFPLLLVKKQSFLTNIFTTGYSFKTWPPEIMFHTQTGRVKLMS
jgi:hypothetical protein